MKTRSSARPCDRSRRRWDCIHHIYNLEEGDVLPDRTGLFHRPAEKRLLKKKRDILVRRHHPDRQGKEASARLFNIVWNLWQYIDSKYDPPLDMTGEDDDDVMVDIQRQRERSEAEDQSNVPLAGSEGDDLDDWNLAQKQMRATQSVGTSEQRGDDVDAAGAVARQDAGGNEAGAGGLCDIDDDDDCDSLFGDSSASECDGGDRHERSEFGVCGEDMHITGEKNQHNERGSVRCCGGGMDGGGDQREVHANDSSDFGEKQEDPRSPKCPQNLLGLKCQPHGVAWAAYTGTVTKVRVPDINKPNERLFRIEYEDNDWEELWRRELEALPRAEGCSVSFPHIGYKVTKYFVPIGTISAFGRKNGTTSIFFVHMSVCTKINKLLQSLFLHCRSWVLYCDF